MNKCLLCGTLENQKDNQLDDKLLKETYLLAHLISLLETPITEFKAYKSGVINESGNIIKKPITQEEKNSFTPIDRYLLNIKRMLGNKTEMLNNALYLEKINRTVEYKTDYENELELKSALKISIKRFKESLDFAKIKQIPTPIVEKMILDIFKQS